MRSFDISDAVTQITYSINQWKSSTFFSTPAIVWQTNVFMILRRSMCFDLY